MTKRRLDESTVLRGFLWGVVIGGLWMLVRLPEAWVRFRQGLFKKQERERLIRRVDPVAVSLDEGRAFAAQRHQRQQG